MKIRSGFVSNSSSSSFIIGLANVKEEKGDFVFDIPREENNWLVENLPYNVSVKEYNGKYRLTMDSFTSAEVSVDVELRDGVLLLDDYGPDEDEYFSYYDSEGDWLGYDYDVDLEDFEEKSQEKYQQILEANGEATYGAGRNG